MTTKKAPNYTAEMTAELVTDYRMADSDEARKEVVEKYAEKFGKVTRSVIAKLNREGVYVKPAKAAKRGGVKKEEQAANLTALVREKFGVTLVSADKLNLVDLSALVEIFTDEMSD